jgi:uncharacterized membrane protein
LNAKKRGDAIMVNRTNWISGAALGAGFMYLMDPDRGRRRRAGVRDKMVHGLHRTSNGVEVAARDMAHRTQGVAARARGRLLQHQVDEPVLVARVRAKLGRLVSHPHAIEVTADQTKVTLRGLVLTQEMDDLIKGIESIPGVKQLDNQLKAYENYEHIPSLQGGRTRAGERSELIQTNWSPAARFMVCTSAMLPLLAGLKRRDAAGYMMTGVGLGLAIRALSNVSLKQFLGFGSGSMITVHKTIQIDALPEDVFRFWSDFDNFPQFLPEVIEVRDLGQNRSRWSVAGPGRLPVHWNAITTRYEPNSMIAWRSEPGALIKNAGRIQFISEPDGGTRIEMDLSYRPPVGRLGHAVAKLFGTDPKSRLDDALVRVKSLLERGFSDRLGKVAAGY